MYNQLDSLGKAEITQESAAGYRQVKQKCGSTANTWWLCIAIGNCRSMYSQIDSVLLGTADKKVQLGTAWIRQVQLSEKYNQL